MFYDKWKLACLSVERRVIRKFIEKINYINVTYVCQVDVRSKFAEVKLVYGLATPTKPATSTCVACKLLHESKHETNG